jgi:flavin reductase (DIM6/NTAB) family NADH-FMN oxidoreductase RutF
MSQKMAELFKCITTGVYVIGVAANNRSNAFTAAWVMPVSFRPLLLAFSINPQHSSYQLLKVSGEFSINVLRQDQMALAAQFGQPAKTDKLASVSWRPGVSGAPLLDDVVAHFECKVVTETLAGDHILVIGHVVDGILLQADVVPLKYTDTGDMDGASQMFPDDF